MARIFVVGAGVVGTAVGRGFVEAGHSVTLVDISADRVDALVAAGLDATTRLDLRGEPSSFVFLTVPTPATAQGYDLRSMAVASRDVGRAIGQAHAERGLAGRHSNRRDGRGEGEGYAVHTVVTRSTVPPGTTTQLVGPAIAQASGTPEGVGFVLAANPEFLRGTSAEDDVRWPWMTVVGARSRRVGERLAALLEPFGGELRVFDKPETAELVKCAHNLYNATKISFWNEMWLVSRALGLDPDDIAGTVSRSAEGSLNPGYGIRGGAPFAGRCLPKDTDGFLAFARELGLSMPLLDSVVGVNRELATQVEGELEALSLGAGRVLDLREAERRDAVHADRRGAAGRGTGRAESVAGPVTGVPEGYRSGATGSGQDSSHGADGGYEQVRGYGTGGRHEPESPYEQEREHGHDGPYEPERTYGQDMTHAPESGYQPDNGRHEPHGGYRPDGTHGHEAVYGPGAASGAATYGPATAYGPGTADDPGTADGPGTAYGPGTADGPGTGYGRDDAFERAAEFVQDRPLRHDPGFGRDPRFAHDAGFGWEATPGVPSARGPVSGDLPTVGSAGRDPFTGELYPGSSEQHGSDGRDGRRDERW